MSDPQDEGDFEVTPPAFERDMRYREIPLEEAVDILFELLFTENDEE